MAQRKVAVSVIIPTYKRLKLVQQTVKSIQKQDFSDFEIILVDNEVNPKLKTAIQKINSLSQRKINYLQEPKPGWQNAVHTGAKASQGSVLFFTTDDITFSKDLLKAYWQMYQKHKNMVAAGGPVMPNWEIEPPVWIKNLIGNNRSFPPFSLINLGNKFTLNKKNVFFGANMSITRKAFFAVGGFNPEDVGRKRIGDGEWGLNRKLWRKKWQIGYVPDAVVYHHIPKKHFTMNYLIHWMQNAGAVDMYTLIHENQIPNNLMSRFLISLLLFKINLRYFVGWLFVQSLKASPLLKMKLLYFRISGQLSYLNEVVNDKNLQKLVKKERWI